MSGLTDSQPWKALQAHHAQIASLHLREIFARNPERFDRFSLRFQDIFLDYSKNRIVPETMPLLFNLARHADVEAWRDRMFQGEKINLTEKRSVLHVALRNRANRPILVDGQDVMPKINSVLAQIRGFSEAVRSGSWRGFTARPSRMW